MKLPPIIQGGMGIAVSGWQLASAVSKEGQLGVVSGTGMAVILAQRLQRGDPTGVLRDALARFPAQAVAQRVLGRWFVAGGKHSSDRPLVAPVPTWPMSRELVDLTMLGVFAEIYLAKRHGGCGLIGVNLLTKVEIMTLPSLYGAMLAYVDVVFMGAGIPRMVPGILDAFAEGRRATLPLTVEASEPELMCFDPREALGIEPSRLQRPLFFPIVSSDVLASYLLRKASGAVDGFVVEDYTAGGHNAPPRGGGTSHNGAQPQWDERDRPSLDAFRKLGVPFYVAGGQDDASCLRAAQAQGATGVQVGTAFAFCEESGLRGDLKAAALKASARGDLVIVSDPRASPTGFPFKVVQLSDTLSDAPVYENRERSCDSGYLRSAYRKADGTVGWRCAAEREDAYLSKGGSERELPGRQCLCSALMSAAGIGDPAAPAIVTAGETLRRVRNQLRPPKETYAAKDVIRRILDDDAD